MFTQKEVLPSLTLMSQSQPNCSKTGIVLQFLIYSLIILFLKSTVKPYVFLGPCSGSQVMSIPLPLQNDSSASAPCQPFCNLMNFLDLL